MPAVDCRPINPQQVIPPLNYVAGAVPMNPEVEIRPEGGKGGDPPESDTLDTLDRVRATPGSPVRGVGVRPADGASDRQPQLLQPGAECLAGDPEQLGGPHLVAPGV